MLDLILPQTLNTTQVAEIRYAQYLGDRMGFHYCVQITLEGVKTYDQLSEVTLRSPDAEIASAPRRTAQWRNTNPALYDSYISSTASAVLKHCPAHWQQFMLNNP